MKITFILLAILAGTATWWWTARSHQGTGKPKFAQRFKNFFKCLIAGAVVYFGLMACALTYLMITTP